MILIFLCWVKMLKLASKMHCSLPWLLILVEICSKTFSKHLNKNKTVVTIHLEISGSIMERLLLLFILTWKRTKETKNPKRTKREREYNGNVSQAQRTTCQTNAFEWKIKIKTWEKTDPLPPRRYDWKARSFFSKL